MIPPTPQSVQEMLDRANLDPEHLIGIEPVRNRRLTAEKLAVNAVMAGCLPDHFPLVCESFSAMLKENRFFFMVQLQALEAVRFWWSSTVRSGSRSECVEPSMCWAPATVQPR